MNTDAGALLKLADRLGDGINSKSDGYFALPLSRGEWRLIEAASQGSASAAQAAPVPPSAGSARDILRSICKAGGELGCSCADQNYQWIGQGCKERMAVAFERILASSVPSAESK